jgi:hypothetical protein
MLLVALLAWLIGDAPNKPETYRSASDDERSGRISWHY